MTRKLCDECKNAVLETRISGPTPTIIPRLACLCIVLLIIGWAASFAEDNNLF